MAVWKGFQTARTRGTSWVRSVEHFVLRVASLLFSLVSAHAIQWLFSPLDKVDTLMPIMTWVLGVGFGVLGYFVSRGVADRLMHKESIAAYIPICVIVEFVEVFANFALAASVVSGATWLNEVPVSWHSSLVIMTYCALAIIPAVSVFLAVVDMDLERRSQQGQQGQQGFGGVGNPRGSAPTPKQGNAAYYPTGTPGTPAYQQGYTGNAGTPVTAGGQVAPARQGVRPVAPVAQPQGAQAGPPFAAATH